MQHFFLISLLLLLSACATSEIFKSLGDQLASPLTIVIDAANSRAYLNNSNSRVHEFNAEEGSIHVLDISTPASPTRVGSAIKVDSFSGEMVLDSAKSRLLMANRYSANSLATSDKLFNFSLADPSLPSLTNSVATLKDPFGMACCDSENRLLVTTGEHQIQYIDLDDDSLATPTTLSLSVALDTGGTIASSPLTHIAIAGSQALVSRSIGLFVLDLEELANNDVSAVDYFISDIDRPRGVAVNQAGTQAYVLSRQIEGGAFVSRLLILDLSTLPRLASNTTTVLKENINDFLLKSGQTIVGSIQVGNDPQEIVVGSTHAFISDQDDQTVTVVDLATNEKVGSPISLSSGEPFGMAILTNATSGTDTHLFVCKPLTNKVDIIDIDPSSATFLTVVGNYP